MANMNPPIWVTPIHLEELNRRCQNTLAGYLKIQFTEVGNDFLTAVMPVEAMHMQPMGIMHGGASCVLAETIGSVAAYFCVDQKLKTCVGLDININHMRPVRSGILTAITKPFHLGKTTQVWEIQIRDQKQKMVAVSRLTVAVIGIGNISEEKEILKERIEGR